MKGKCPHCKRAVTFMAVGMANNQFDKTCATYLQKTGTGFVMRFFDITKRYSNAPEHPAHYRHPILEIHESARHFFGDDSNNWSEAGEHYEFEEFKKTKIWRWCKSKTNGYTWTTPLYTRNLRHVLADTPWQYSALDELAKNTQKLCIQGYMRQYKQRPAYEYLVKAKLYNLVLESINHYGLYGLKFEGKSLPEILGVNKLGVRQLQRLNGISCHLNLIQISEEMGKSLTDDQLQALYKMNLGSNISLIKDLLKLATPQKIINYINRCLVYWDKEKHSSPAVTIATYWRDYLKNCKLLGYDIGNDFNIFPRDLKTRHDEVVADFKVQKNVIQEKAILEMHQALQNQFGFHHEGLGLVAMAPSTRVVRL